VETNRKSIAALTITAALLLGVSQHEGFREAAYIPIKGDVPTIGFGSTVHPNGTPVKIGDVISRKTAESYLKGDLDKFKTGLMKCVKVPLYENEFNAYMKLTYNIGASAFCNSSIPHKLNTGQYEEACKTILQFNKMRDTSKPMVRNTQGKMVYQLKVIKGLDNRRKSEYKECIGEPL
jgi:lysozyme